MAEQFDIWSIPVEPTKEQHKTLLQRYGFWMMGEILTTRKFLEKHCLHLKPVLQSEFDATVEDMTLDEMRASGAQFFQEVDRLLLLGEKKTLHALRSPERMGPIFIDPKEDAVRFWALQNPHDNAWIYKEEWAMDTKTGKLRVLTREPLDNPVETALKNKNKG